MQFDPNQLRVLRDIAERCFFTFAESFLAVLLLNGLADLSLGTAKAAAVAGLAAALTYFKGTLASLKADTFSPGSVATDTTTSDRDPVTGRYVKRLSA